MFERFLRCEDGAVAIEYALIAGLIVLAIVTAVAELGHYVGQTYDHVAEETTKASGG